MTPGACACRQETFGRHNQTKANRHDRKIARQIDRPIGRQPDRQLDRQTDRQIPTDNQTDRQTERRTNRQASRPTQTDRHRQTDTQTDGQTSTQTDRLTDRKTKQADRRADGRPSLDASNVAPPPLPPTIPKLHQMGRHRFQTKLPFKHGHLHVNNQQINDSHDAVHGSMGEINVTSKVEMCNQRPTESPMTLTMLDAIQLLPRPLASRAPKRRELFCDRNRHSMRCLNKKAGLAKPRRSRSGREKTLRPIPWLIPHSIAPTTI